MYITSVMSPSYVRRQVNDLVMLFSAFIIYKLHSFLTVRRAVAQGLQIGTSSISLEQIIGMARIDPIRLAFQI